MASETNSRFILITQPPAEETPNPLGGNGEHRNEGRRRDELASVDMSATGDEIMSNAEFFADAVSCQSSDDELFYIDRRKGTRNGCREQRVERSKG